MIFAKIKDAELAAAQKAPQALAFRAILPPLRAQPRNVRKGSTNRLICHHKYFGAGAFQIVAKTKPVLTSRMKKSLRGSAKWFF
jgi:hypothetical protein